MAKIKIILDSAIELLGELFENPLGKEIADNLPIELHMDRWGEELYGELGIKIKRQQGEFQEVMDIGDLAYHPDTTWFCIFWGPTLSSRKGEIRAAVPVIKVGKVSGDWERVSLLSTHVIAKIESI